MAPLLPEPTLTGRREQRLELLLTLQPSLESACGFFAKNVHAQPSLPPALLLLVLMGSGKEEVEAGALNSRCGYCCGPAI